MKKTVLVVVTHPDDETIWMGGTMLINVENWDLTIISLSRKDDLDRAPKFQKICNIYKAKGFMSDLEDEKLIDLSTEEVIKRISEFAEKSYDIIYTHGENGEYGNPRHVLVHNAVNEMLLNKLLSCKELFFFSYLMKDNLSYPKNNSDVFVKLNDTTFNRKKELIEDIYGFRKDSFESICSKNEESFDKGVLA